MLLTGLLVLLSIAGCAPGQTEATPPEIIYGETVCAKCNMIISDERFAAGYAYEVAAGRYESLAFDDVGDMLEYAAEHPEHAIKTWYVHDYADRSWLDAATATYVVSQDVQSPMGSGIAAFADAAAANELAQRVNGQVYDWPGLRAIHP